MNQAPSPAAIQQLLLLRTIVAVLGERTAPPWWRTQYLTEPGLRAMSRVFPRTAASAGLNSITLAARADHDTRIGVGGRYHLFRLPSATEHAVSQEMSLETFHAKVSGIVSKGQDALIQELAGIANGRVIGLGEGPISLGVALRLASAAGIEELAAHYKVSFESNRRIFPYLESAGDES